MCVSVQKINILRSDKSKMFITIFVPWKRDLKVTSLFFRGFTLFVLVLFEKNKT